MCFYGAAQSGLNRRCPLWTSPSLLLFCVSTQREPSLVITYVCTIQGIGDFEWVVSEWRGDKVRIIHAREASPALRKRYKERRKP